MKLVNTFIQKVAVIKNGEPDCTKKKQLIKLIDSAGIPKLLR
jgi:hypothetical protein